MGSQSQQNLLETYGNVNLHEEIGTLIRSHSSNKSNIYQLALEHLTIESPIQILDLGCGFGSFSGSVSAIIPSNSKITGIDMLCSNQQSFLNQFSQSGIDGAFICESANAIREMKNESYDIILSGFSLYFFPELLSEITRILKPNGRFVAITHSSLSLTELLDDIRYAMDSSVKLSAQRLELDLTLTKFNAENGHDILSPHFQSVEMTHYANQMVFNESTIEDCLKYVYFKLKTISLQSRYHETFDHSDFREKVKESIHNKIASSGHYTLNKNDAIFHCQKPVKQGIIP